ncbi:unnamed protein product [Arabis nemorensis]|uniref:Low-temperature-induced 65 kDa protein n=1 Tax=Arabis nemorensis TaxID=586526 RepID=A0A565ATA0_9BRAS|nr:unnamed protein product [Arabis nemorensis]
MDSQAQMKRNYGHHEAEEPIRIQHPEEEEHHEKGPSKVLKKVKEKAKKIKKALTKHGHGDEHDRGTKAFPVVSSSHAKPTRGVDPIRGSYASHGHEAPPPRPVRASDVSENEKRRDSVTLTPHNTPVSSSLSSTEDVTRTSVPGLGSLGGISNYQSKFTAPTGKGNNFDTRRKGTGEDDQLGHGRDLPEKSPGSGLGREIPVRSHELDVKSGSDLEPNQSSYSDKIASATSVITDKAVAAKNAVASKLGYSGDGEGEETRSSGGGYGSMVSEKLTPIYDKVKETGATVMTKLPLSGGTETETRQGQDKGVSAREYLTEKLSPGEEDKALSKVVTEKLHLGGENTTAPVKKGIVTQSEEVEKRLGGFSDQRSQEERKHGEAFAEEGEGGMVEKLRGAVTSWLAGTTEEVVQKSTESSSQSLGSTVGNIAAGQTDGGDNNGSVPVQKRFQESGN